MDPRLWPVIAARLAAGDLPAPAQTLVLEPPSARSARITGMLFDANEREPKPFTRTYSTRRGKPEQRRAKGA